MAIDVKIKKKWIAALRSGKYKQGKGALKHNGRYCCLGVLACVVDPEEKTWQPGQADFGTKSRGGQTALVGGYISQRKADKLTFLNDDDGLSFKEIAKFIAADRYI